MKIEQENETLSIQGFDQKGIWFAMRLGFLVLGCGVVLFILRSSNPQQGTLEICLGVTALGILWIAGFILAHLTFSITVEREKLVMRTIHKKWTLQGEPMIISRYGNTICGWLVFERKGHGNILIPVLVEGDCDKIADIIAKHYPNCQMRFPWRENAIERKT
jgi:hypothetical protein